MYKQQHWLIGSSTGFSTFTITNDRKPEAYKSCSLCPSLSFPTLLASSTELRQEDTYSNITMSHKVYLITGASRGIGFALTKALSAEPNNIILACARDPARATELNSLALQDNVLVLKLDVASDESIAGLGLQLKEHAPNGIDYFISNAGIATAASHNQALSVSKSVWLHHFTTNVLGPVLISQVVKPYLMKRSTRVMYFVSSLAGSIGGFFEASTSAYGMSKAALNHFTKTLSYELRGDGFTVVAVHPGVVSTEGNQELITLISPEMVEVLNSMIITPEESATQQLEVLKKLAKGDNGKFLSYTGDELLW